MFISKRGYSTSWFKIAQKLPKKGQFSEKLLKVAENPKSCKKVADQNVERPGRGGGGGGEGELHFKSSYITNSQSGQLPVGLIAQLVEHCTGIAEVMGSTAVQA